MFLIRSSLSASTDVDTFIRQELTSGRSVTLTPPNNTLSSERLSTLLHSLAANETLNLSTISISGLILDDELNLTYFESPFSIKLDNCTFNGNVILTKAHFQKDLSLRHCTFTGEARLQNIRVDGDADLSDTTFKDSAHFENAMVDGDLQLEGCLFNKGPIDFYGMRVGSALLRTAKFYGRADFSNCLVSGDLNLYGAEFHNGKAIFHRARVDSDFLLKFATFDGGADFSGVFVEKFLLMEGARFNFAAETMDCQNLHVGEDTLVPSAIFLPRVLWSFGEAKGIYFTGAEFRGGVEFSSNKVSNSVSFHDCVVKGGIICRENKIADDLDFSGARIEQGSVSNPAEKESYGVDLYRTKVSGILKLRNTSIDGRISLDRLDAGDVDVTEIQLLGKADAVVLNESIVKRFHPGWNDKDTATVRKLLDGASYDPEAYSELESALRVQGDAEDADKVYIKSQERSRDERLHTFSLRWIKNWTVRILTAYGREPGWIVVWSLVIVACGTAVFWKEENMVERKKAASGKEYNAFWFSLDVFAPIIDLEAASVWEPKPNDRFRWLWLRIQRILGWILIPVAVVAISGLIQGAAG